MWAGTRRRENWGVWGCLCRVWPGLGAKKPHQTRSERAMEGYMDHGKLGFRRVVASDICRVVVLGCILADVSNRMRGLRRRENGLRRRENLEMYGIPSKHEHFRKRTMRFRAIRGTPGSALLQPHLDLEFSFPLRCVLELIAHPQLDNWKP